MQFDWRPGSYAVVVSGGAVLLSLWDGPAEPIWTLPGGGIEYQEQPEEACLREVEEETGYRVELGELISVSTRAIPAAQRLRAADCPLMQLRVLYRASVISGELRPEIEGSSIDAAWIPLDELHQHVVAPFVFEALTRAGCLPERSTP